jgi:hypothetical protein
VPKQINTPTPGQKLVRQFGLKGRFQPLLDVVIVPTVSVESDAERFRYWQGMTQGAVVGEYTTAYLLNPSGSVVNALVDLVSLQMSAAVGVTMTLDWLYTVGSTAVTTIAGEARDPKAAFRPSTVTYNYGTSSAPNLSGIDLYVATGNQQFLYPYPEVILGPGMGFQVVLSTANLGGRLAIGWQETFINVTDL